MRMTGQCDFCHQSGNWEAGIFHDQADVKGRPKHWAAAFPTNVENLPAGCTFRPEDLEKHQVETAVACPQCVRHANASFTPKPKATAPKAA